MTRVDRFENYRLKSRKTRILERQLLGLLTIYNFTGLSILTSDIDPKILY